MRGPWGLFLLQLEEHFPLQYYAQHRSLQWLDIVIKEAGNLKSAIHDSSNLGIDIGIPNLSLARPDGGVGSGAGGA